MARFPYALAAKAVKAAIRHPNIFLSLYRSNHNPDHGRSGARARARVLEIKNHGLPGPHGLVAGLISAVNQ
jgi:hypothetical protein